MRGTEDDLLGASCRVALAAYLHDLGKFAERARADVSADALAAHKTLYCPFRTTDPGGKNGFHTHVHAAYTGLAFDLLEQTAPDLVHGDMYPFAGRGTGAGDPHGTTVTDSLVNAAAAHHKPETFLQWIVATADRVASGFERDEFDRYNLAPDENTETPTGRNHYQARQLSLLEQIRLAGKADKVSSANLKWRYPLAALTPSSVFPQPRTQCEPGDDGIAQQQYRTLWLDFLDCLHKTPASHRANWPLWLDHFDTAWLTFTHAIPAATAFGTKPEVSLYDHSKTAAALATAMWRWHAAAGATNASAAQQLRERSDWDTDKFLLIQGDFFGIQDFIFADGSATSRSAARLLRGRSFQVSLFSELAALRVLDALALPPTSQITNAAGKFLIVAPNTATVRAQLDQVRQELGQWFLRHSIGLAGVGLVGRQASCNDFLKDRFKTLMQDLFGDLEQAKLHRFDLTEAADPVFRLDYPLGVCQYNARLPADGPDGDGQPSAALSRDQIALGTHLASDERILVVRDPSMLAGNGVRQLEVPVFGFAVAFTRSEAASGKFGALAKNGSLLRCWDFSLPENLDDTVWHGYARRHVNAFVPRFRAADQQLGGKYAGAVDGQDNEVRVGTPKSLNHIACEDRSCPNDPQRWQGQVALMTLKGDVDNLGVIFQHGLQEPTFAKMAALSRQMNAFFALWLPAVCAQEFPDTYTVFAGGDDFFLIGPWLQTQRLADRMAQAFRVYAAENPDVTFSAGMVMTKPGLPVHTLAAQAEQALAQAKGEDKNALLLFGERVRWPDWAQVREAQLGLERVNHSYDLSTAYVYGLLQLIALATDRKDPEHAMWRSRFAYRTRRHVVDKLKPAVRVAAQQDLAEQLGEKGIASLGTRFRIPLFNFFYRQR